MSRKAVFLDLNGTLVLPIQVEKPGELRLIPGAGEAVARLSAAGYLCPVVTVQSRISKRFFTIDEFLCRFHELSAELSEEGAILLGPYVCPHRFSEPCSCKKPQTLLYEQAAEEYGIDLGQSFVIGDSADDVAAARNFGGRGCLVRTGWASDAVEVERARPYEPFVADSLTAAVDWVLAIGPPPGRGCG
jgi:histidinol-phosphate phosphatase family protein